VQVTRADQGLWGRVRALGEAWEQHETQDAAADAVRDAVAGKILSGRGWVLALDARHPGWASLPAVVDAFRRRHGAWAAGLGFDSIWAVGPVASLVQRLDVAD
jgi:hypothetical protein